MQTKEMKADELRNSRAYDGAVYAAQFNESARTTPIELTSETIESEPNVGKVFISTDKDSLVVGGNDYGFPDGHLMHFSPERNLAGTKRQFAAAYETSVGYKHSTVASHELRDSRINDFFDNFGSVETLKSPETKLLTAVNRGMIKAVEQNIPAQQERISKLPKGTWDYSDTRLGDKKVMVFDYLDKSVEK